MGGKPRRKLALGWLEEIELPELTDISIKAKVDTGARSSALHAEEIRIVRRGNERFVRFRLLPRQRSVRDACDAIAPLVGFVEVRSSNGALERRPVIRTLVIVGAHEREAEITLTSRGPMKYRMLLGRKTIRKLDGTVNPVRSFLGSR